MGNLMKKHRKHWRTGIMKYKNRYTDKAKQNAYMNACDCLYFGFGKIFWNDCGCNDDSVWDQAMRDMKDL